MKENDNNKDKTVSRTFLLSFYLLLRVVLVSVLSLMAIPLMSWNEDIMCPILAVFYLFVLFYFFCFTSYTEGFSDRNRIETGIIRENKNKGFLSAGILLAVMFAVGGVLMVLRTTDNYSNFGYVILNIIYMAFAYSTSFSIYFFQKGSYGITDVSGGDIQRLTSGLIVFAVIYIIAFILAGISYRIGNAGKHPVKDAITKIKSAFSKGNS